jgi:hypothetical protein
LEPLWFNRIVQFVIITSNQKVFIKFLVSMTIFFSKSPNIIESEKWVFLFNLRDLEPRRKERYNKLVAYPMRFRYSFTHIPPTSASFVSSLLIVTEVFSASFRRVCLNLGQKAFSLKIRPMKELNPKTL